jgi:hypothetical protein
LKNKLSDLRSRNSEISEEIEAIDRLDLLLNSEKSAAERRAKVAEWDGNSAALLSLAKEIEPLIVALGSKLMKAAPIVSKLSVMTPNSATYRPGSLWNDSISAKIARHFDGAELARLPRRIDVHPDFFADAEFLVEHLEKVLKSIRELLIDPPVDQ